VLKAANGMGTH